MRMRTLGGTGIKVSSYCLGAMMFGAWGNQDHDDSIRIIHAALDAGINFIDTADVYSQGESEEIVGKALAGRRDDVVLATKGRAQRIPRRFDPALPGNARKLELVEELTKVAADAGTSLTHLAVAFTAAHPAVTATIIGPRTMDQLQDLLAGADVTLDDEVLDRIDAIVPPGLIINDADAGWAPPALTDARQRRRPASDRSAA